MTSTKAYNMYDAHGPLPLKIAKTLLDENKNAKLRGYCSSSDSQVGPYEYAIIDLCDLEATIHAYDPEEELREGHSEFLEEL